MSAIRRRSLCCTCLHEEQCLKGRSLECPIVHCELFDCGPPAAAAPVSAMAVVAVRVADPEARGLCVNCDHRLTCKLPRLEGGIWHCEEYR